MSEAIEIPSRSDLVVRYERDYRLRREGAIVGEGTLPGLDARLHADMLLPLYAEARRLGGLASLEGYEGDALEQLAEDLGIPRRLPAVGASGFVLVTTALGGATILAGDTLTNQLTGLRYQCTLGGVYNTGDQVPVQGIDTGPQSNVDAGTVLSWASPSPGLAPTCTVVAQLSGEGLSGGRTEEPDEDIRRRITQAESDPVAAANDAALRDAALRTPALSIEAVFTYPCILGPGTTSMVFTMRPSTIGGNRIPNAAQRAAVLAHIVGQFPVDDSILMATLTAEPIPVRLRVRWARAAAGWTDPVPWPPYDVADFTIDATPTPTATTFGVVTTMPSPPQPAVGRTIAVWNASTGKFVRKRILSFTGTGPWTITVDTTFGASDTQFAPVPGTAVSPWSDSLQAVGDAVLKHFAGLGPGEQVPSAFDTAGLRQRRTPASNVEFPFALTARLLSPLFDLGVVEDVAVIDPSLPVAPAPGTPGVNANLLTLDHLSITPL